MDELKLFYRCIKSCKTYIDLQYLKSTILRWDMIEPTRQKLLKQITLKENALLTAAKAAQT